MNALKTYFQESLQELHQVRWPTRQQAIRLSAITIAFTGASAVSFGGVDFLLSKAVHFLLSFS